MVARVRIGSPRQAERFMAQIGDHPIDHGQDRRRRAEALVHRQVEEVALDRPRLAGEPGAGDVEAVRIGPLEAEDRLLVIADGEDRPVALRRPLPGEILAGQRADDVPLPLVGVLGLVDEDMVGLAVELVAHPVAHAGRQQQLLGPRDQIVEIDRARRPLGLGISERERLPRAQAGRERRDQPGEPGHGQQPPAAGGEPLGQRLVIGRRLEQSGRGLARIAGFGEHQSGEIGQARRPPRPVPRQPGGDDVAALQAGGGAPGPVGGGDRAQEREVERTRIPGR